jgi:ribosomal protein S18 acetylase RimI-like enzyme
MTVEELGLADRAAAVALWEAAALTRPWNDPAADFDRARTGPTSAVLGLRADGVLAGTVMVGHDGHRGWIYYLAVAPELRSAGRGAALMAAAEDWLRAAGAVKVELMVRRANAGMVAFYEGVGYELEDVHVLSRWLTS